MYAKYLLKRVQYGRAKLWKVSINLYIINSIIICLQGL